MAGPIPGGQAGAAVVWQEHLKGQVRPVPDASGLILHEPLAGGRQGRRRGEGGFCVWGGGDLRNTRTDQRLLPWVR